ncbi:MAG: sugar nucleotide-binding protein, partial [Ferruginibacter sp.]|nr:sugar nucleotide-binding protein [Cytophagales bacterium]
MENQPRSTAPPVEVWGGIECTINRVGDRYIDQFDSSGHYLRLDDLDRFAEIGLRTLRYPILWERHLPSHQQPDWRFADERLARLRQLGIRPIVGLVHHGSGPRHTQLDDPGFADGLAHYARLVAERFPWVEAYTPVNEPLTTARFSGLYGLWYPHHRSNAAFARMLINQCRATVLAMAEIRKVQPRAQLVQTEDLGQCHSTFLLAYQADFENERRWLTFDILGGLLNRTHPLWKHLRELGIAESELVFFLENPCPPDLIGINHYLTSERYLDERLERYPGYAHGGNHYHTYVDIEAIRVPEAEPVGPYGLLKQTWERYRRPMAVTEVHLGCTREEQLRWFGQVWKAANRLKSEGADIRAVTAWALLGSYDWDSLLTHERLHYEPGVFDLRAERPRPTALAHLIRGIARKGTPAHPTLEEPGWWQRQTRWTVPRASEVGILKVVKRIPSRPLVIVGANGTLGRAFARICAQRGLFYHLLNRQEMDITNPSQVQRVINQLNPWAVINAAGYERVAQAGRD